MDDKKPSINDRIVITIGIFISSNLFENNRKEESN